MNTLKLPDIQILRAIACFSVLVGHLGFLTAYRPQIFTLSGSQGVLLFFTISGFIIAKSLDKLGMFNNNQSNLRLSFDLLKPKLPLFKIFLIKRFFRIFPLALLTFAMIFFMKLFRFYEDSAGNDILRLFLAFSSLGADLLLWKYYLFEENMFLQGGFYWSLSGEEKAYLLFALLSMFAKDTKQIIKFCIIWIVFFYSLHFVLSMFVNSKQGLFGIFYCSPFITISQFFSGCLAYFVYKKFSPENFISKRTYIPILLTLLFLTFSCFAVYPNNLYGHLVSLVLSGVIVYISSTNLGFFPSWLGLRNLLIKMGDRTFTIYMIHMPLQRFLDVLYSKDIIHVPFNKGILVCILLVVSTEIIHKTFELPFIRYGRGKTSSLTKNNTNDGLKESPFNIPIDSMKVIVENQ